MQTQVQAVLDEWVNDGNGRETGLQVAIYRHGQLRVSAWAGWADRANERRVDGETLFCTFSASKGVTATLIHALVERGALAYDRPIAHDWPAFAANGKQDITLRMVLTHTAGIPHLPPDFLPEHLADWPRMVAWVEQATPLWEPGSATGYHALTWGWILGELAQRVTGKPFAQLVREFVTGPLGIEGDVVFGKSESGVRDRVDQRVAVLENDPPPKQRLRADALILRATPLSLFPLSKTHNRPDVRAAVLPASGGLMTAQALARHYAALIGSGVDGVRLLFEQTVAQATTLQTDALDRVLEVPYRKALGYYLGTDAPQSEMTALPHAFGHPGSGGTIGWVDPSTGWAFALCKTRLTFRPYAQSVARAIKQIIANAD